jgi:hypothetical protein
MTFTLASIDAYLVFLEVVLGLATLWFGIGLLG